jgi:hypothetical protein
MREEPGGMKRRTRLHGSASAVRRPILGVLVCTVAALLLTACGGRGQVGAGALSTTAPVGANEQMPGATPQSDNQLVNTAGAVSAAVSTNLSEPFDCPGQSTTAPTTSSELREDLKNAKPGDVILLSPGEYTGHFVIDAKGTDTKPIFICGPDSAALSGVNHLSGYTLHIQNASNIRMDGFTVRQGLKGIMVDNSTRIVFQNMTVADVGEEALHLRDNSSNNVVRSLTIRKSGERNAKFGEGVYVGSAKSNWCDVTKCKPDLSNNNQIIGNRFSFNTAEAIDIKEGTTGGVIQGNTFDGRGMNKDGADSWVDVKGNDWQIKDNHGRYSLKDGYQTHVILAGWGTGNVFTDNSATLGNTTGVAIYLMKQLKNTVSCDNKVAGSSGLSNFPCHG